MYLNTAHRQGLAECFALLAEAADARALREALGPQLLRLLRADHFASYVWDEARGRFDQGVALGMSATNLARYEAWFQYDDPITFRLQSRRHATCASSWARSCRWSVSTPTHSSAALQRYARTTSRAPKRGG